MQYIAFIFAIFGFIAYLEISNLKKRIAELERQLGGMSGTTYSEDRAALAEAVRALLGQPVTIELDDDHQDVDITMYGNRRGSNTILDTDGEWMLVRIESPKGVKEKLIRLESVKKIQLDHEEK